MICCTYEALDFCLLISVIFSLMHDVVSVKGPSFKVLNATENKIHIEWTPVSSLNVLVMKYQVSAYPVKSYSKTDMLNRNEWTFYNTTFKSDLVGLHPGTLYNISVWAITSEGLSDLSSESIWTEIGDPDKPLPVEIVERKGHTLLVNLPSGESDKGPVTSYNVVVLERSPLMSFNPDELGDYRRSQENGLPFYITANLKPEDANETFIVGDNKLYNGYFNAPLSEDKEYEVLVGVISTLNGITKVYYSSLQSDVTTQRMSNSDSVVPTSSALSVILSAAIGVFGFLLVLCVIMYFFLKKHYGKRRSSDEMVLKVHSSDGDEHGLMSGLTQISEVTDLVELYETLKGHYWQIPRNHLDVHQTVLGIGHFGEVREGVVHKKSEAIPCILQLIQAPSVLMDKEKRSLLSELNIVVKAGFHMNIVDFLGACDEQDVLYVAISHYPSSLRGLLLRSRQVQNGKISTLSEPLLLELASGITQGMAHLSDRGIVHRHLSARNILIAEGYIPKIAHFGLGYYNPLGKKLMYTKWTAPEALNLNIFTSKCDVWSFGILLWEILTIGGSPYNDLTPRDVLPRLMNGTRLPRPIGISDDLYQVMLHCWELDSDERPKFMEISSLLQSMFLNAKDHINFQDSVNYHYEKFDPNAEDQ